jgi:hypothetical protein
MEAWRQLPAPNRRWLVVNAVLVTAVINVVVNYLIAEGAVAGRDSIPMWGVPLVEPSVFWDLIGTLFLLPLITSALTTAAIRRDIRRGTLEQVAPLPGAHPRLAAPGRWRRGAAFGGLAVVALTPGLLILLAALGFPELSKSQFVAWHTGFAVVLGVLVTPPLAVLAMADPPVEKSGGGGGDP